MTIGGVDEDIDFATDLAGEFAHRGAVGDVERHRCRLRYLAQLWQTRDLLPRLGFAHPNRLGAGVRQSAHDRLTGCRLAVGDQDFSSTRIARHLTQFRVGGQVGPPVWGYGEQYGLAGAVQCRFDANAARRGGDALVQINDKIGAAVEADHSDAPGKALAEIKLLRGMQDGVGEEFALTVVRTPNEPGG